MMGTACFELELLQLRLTEELLWGQTLLRWIRLFEQAGFSEFEINNLIGRAL